MYLDHAIKIANGLLELLFTRNPFGQVELTADLGCGVIKRHGMSAFRCHCRKGQSRRTRTDHTNTFRHFGPLISQKRFMASSWINKATDFLKADPMIEACLVARDTGFDFFFTAFRRFHHEFSIGQHGSRHGNEIRFTFLKHGFGHIGHIDPIAGNGGNTEMFAHAAHDLDWKPHAIFESTSPLIGALVCFFD